MKYLWYKSFVAVIDVDSNAYRKPRDKSDGMDEKQTGLLWRTVKNKLSGFRFRDLRNKIELIFLWGCTQLSLNCSAFHSKF